jgi:predicted O-methyltransferase YrrM
MYNSFQLLKKYLAYWWHASNGKGHGIHSPFVYAFVEQVLNGKQHREEAMAIETQRRQLLSSQRKLEINDLGAGSRKDGISAQRTVASIARTALKSPKYAQLMHRMASYYHCKNVVELGTSLGITTAYLATSSPAVQVYSFEGVPDIVSVANDSFDALGLKNIEVIYGNFDDTFPAFLEAHQQIDLLYIDGNHRLEPTLRYFDLAWPSLHTESIVVFDDIHWSAEMEEAWENVKADARVTLTIDLFFIGLAFFHTDFKVKQHFTIRY